MNRLVAAAAFSFIVSSCASSPTISTQINSLVVANRPHLALKVLEENKERYGPANRQLYLLDYGILLHLAGRYEESIAALEEAKDTYDKLYTISISKQLTTWLVNDNTAPYRGEDYERVMINIFQALNFVKINNMEEAIVEARNADNVLSLINQQYDDNAKNVYKEDAFARFLMGILYETQGSSQSLDDAVISYKKAIEVYDADYRNNYKTEPPRILLENYLSLSKFIRPHEFREFQSRISDAPYMNFQEKQKKGEVYLIHYDGLSPMKYQGSIPIVLADGHLMKIAFPLYERRVYETDPGIFKAVGANQNTVTATTEEGEDITAIAMKNLDQKRLRITAKTLLRSGGKLVLAQTQTNRIEGKSEHGADAFRYASSMYNYFSEQADLRSWQTLPAQIRIGRLFVDPGEYEFFLNDKNLGTLSLKAGQTEFLIVRTNQ